MLLLIKLEDTRGERMKGKIMSCATVVKMPLRGTFEICSWNHGFGSKEKSGATYIWKSSVNMEGKETATIINVFKIISFNVHDNSELYIIFTDEDTEILED